LKQSQAYTEGLRERYKVERKFGEARRWHGFIRCVVKWEITLAQKQVEGETDSRRES